MTTSLDSRVTSLRRRNVIRSSGNGEVRTSSNDKDSVTSQNSKDKVTSLSDKHSRVLADKPVSETR